MSHLPRLKSIFNHSYFIVTLVIGTIGMTYSINSQAYSDHCRQLTAKPSTGAGVVKGDASTSVFCVPKSGVGGINSGKFCVGGEKNCYKGTGCGCCKGALVKNKCQ